jgi:hypothetical protein
MTLQRPSPRVLAALLVLLGGGAAAVAIRAADHRDSTLLTANPAVDINDVYSFVNPANPANVVLAMTVSPLIPPTENGTRGFEPNALYQFKIDTDGDAVEDLVIQALATGDLPRQTLRVLGPGRPAVTGSRSQLLSGRAALEIPVSAGVEARVVGRGGMRGFAGLRDDPFFFDLAQFQAILAGRASGFRNPGVDAFAGFNTLAIVLELPAAMLGSSPAIGVWGTTSRITD